MCIGLRLCSKKNCLEQETCLFPEARAAKGVRINQCQIHKKFCSNEKACEILGQCILDHPLIKKDKEASRELKKKCGFNQVIKIAERLMPSLNKPGFKNKKTNR